MRESFESDLRSSVRSVPGQYEYNTRHHSSSLDNTPNQEDGNLLCVNNNRQTLNNTHNSPFQVKAKRLLTLSPGTLRPSVSTSCLLGASKEVRASNNSLVTNPTRASLTHEWKKLKTPNKCRECNLLVYFNGRECSFCGFVAHKKCVTVLVIKCSGQEWSDFMLNRDSKKDRLNKTSNSDLKMSLDLPDSNKQQSNDSSLRFGLKRFSSRVNLSTQGFNQSYMEYLCKTKGPIRPLFGQPICIDSYQVIDFVKRFIHEIDTRGLNSRGIYRVSSIKSKVDRLCNYYDQNLCSLIDLSSFHPNIIANALKMYLRQLPEPLLTHRLYNSFIQVAKKYASVNTNSNQHGSVSNQSSPSMTPSTSFISMGQRLKKSHSSSSHLIKSDNEHLHDASQFNTTSADYIASMIGDLTETVEKLPAINRELIGIIMTHLKRVADMSDENQMSAKNLSIIFGPTLLNAQAKSLAIVDNIHQARLVELMIIWSHQIFPLVGNCEPKAVIESNLSDLRQQSTSTYRDDVESNKNPHISPVPIESERLLVEKDQESNLCSLKSRSTSNLNHLVDHQPCEPVVDRFKQQAVGKTFTVPIITTTTTTDTLQPLPNTRQDLHEMRRQFFTATPVDQIMRPTIKLDDTSDSDQKSNTS